MSFSIESILSYVNFIWWLIHDAIWRNKGMSFAVLVTGFLGVTFQIQVFALIIYYAKHFSSGEMMRIWKYEFDPRLSILLLVTFSMAVLLSLLLAAISVYLSRVGILKLGRKYGEFCARRVISLVSSSENIFCSNENDVVDEKFLFRLITADSIFCNRILLMLLSLIIPTLTLASTIVVLVYLEPFLSLIILCLISIYTFLQSKVSKKTAAHSLRYEKQAPIVSQQYRALIQHLKLQPQNNVGNDMAAPLYERGAVKVQLDTYLGLLSGVENSRLVSGIFTAIAMSIILLVMGGEIIREGTGWGRLLIYVVALRYTISNLQSSFAITTSVNRFYPQVRRYFRFVQCSFSEDKTGYTPLDNYELRTGKTCLEGSRDRMVVGPGSRLALVSPLELHRYTMASLARSFLGESEQVLKSAVFSMRFVTAKHSSPQMSLRNALGLDAQSAWPNLKAWFPDEGLWEMAKQRLPNDLDKSINLETWETVEPKLKFVLSLISAANSDCQWILVEAIALSLLDQGSAMFYLDLLKDRIAVLVFNKDVSQVGAYGEDGVAVATEEELLGTGSPEWFAGVSGEVKEALWPDTLKKVRKGAIEDEDEDQLLYEM